jgi:predicted RecB family nuclease
VPTSRPRSLSKSRFCQGLQCLKLLWWRTHEPDAPELVATPSLEAIFDRGHLVGARARAEFPGGTLIDREHGQYDEKLADTGAALAAGATAIYEACFSADGVFAAVDVLERRRHGFGLIEVKSTLESKPQHLPDVAIQLHVLRRSGLDVTAAELMHLNRDCRFPDLSNLFVRDDVTGAAERFLPSIPGHLARMRAALEGPLPVVEVGPHCVDPYPCPFRSRCWPAVGDDHVSHLHAGGRIAGTLQVAGIESIRDIPEGTRLSAIQVRQVRAARSGQVVVEGDLAGALATLVPPVAYLDFETIAPAIPVWSGCGPYMAVPVQLSCHLVDERGTITHQEHLAEGPVDPRPMMAEAVLQACAGSRTVVAYNASFERRCIEHLAEHVPSLRQPLLEEAAKLVDLLPVVRNHVYHPGFGGSFSMKAVAPALVPGIDYAELEIGEGGTASTALEALLLEGESLDAGDRDTVRTQLLEYCALDTMAMVRVVERLRKLA